MEDVAYAVRGLVCCLLALILLACGSGLQGDNTFSPAVTGTVTVPVVITSPGPADSPSPVAAFKATNTPRPTFTPRPVSTPLPSTPTEAAMISPTPAAVWVQTQTLTLQTYPFADYLYEDVDPVYGMPVLYLDRAAYDAANPTPGPVGYEAVVLENAHLRLTFLPSLGGRLYSAVLKPTQQEIFYHNPVIKPSRYGGLHFDGRQPVESNWWLAAGGMEWAYPTQEHGYRWGIPWTYETRQTTTAASITLQDRQVGRVGAVVTVTLNADETVFQVEPEIINEGAQPVPVQFWLNAALTLAPETMAVATEFVVPVDEVLIHSRGDESWSLPPGREVVSWPLVDGLDLTQYANWASYLGFFVPYLDAPFVAAHNPVQNLSVVRLVPPGQIPGTKFFAFGTSFPDYSYTDGPSRYFEIWGGLNTGFWPEDDFLLPPGERRSWREAWWPISGLDGVTWANSRAALHVQSGEMRQRLFVSSPRPLTGQLQVRDGNDVLLNEPLALTPGQVFSYTLLIDTDLQIELKDADGNLLLRYPPPPK